jgi:release factor glutamine methyltransferase
MNQALVEVKKFSFALDLNPVSKYSLNCTDFDRASMQIRQALRAAIASLREQNIPSAELAAELLLMYVLGSDRSYLYSHPESDLVSGVAERYSCLIAERSTGRPTQYITGRQEFWGLDFSVTPDVLIPRPETEHLVETVLQLAGSRVEGRGSSADEGVPRSESLLRIVDAGTGSGCIALALASELPEAQVFATDISRAALEVARRNAVRLGLADRVRFVETDLLSGLSAAAQFDFVVSNPPYVSLDELDSVQREVREFEPRIAWAGSGEGEAIYRRLFLESLRVLGPGGYVVVEVGYNQAGRVLAMFDENWSNAEVRPDLAGIPRIVMARKRAASCQPSVVS